MEKNNMSNLFEISTQLKILLATIEEHGGELPVDLEAARYDVAIRCFKTEVQQVRTELKRSIEDVVDSRVIALMTERSARDFNTDERLTGLEEAIEIMKAIK